MFRGETQGNSRYLNKEGKRIYLVNPVNIVKTCKIGDVKLINKLLEVHALHLRKHELLYFLGKQKIKAAALLPSLKEKLYRQQKGICSFCSELLEPLDAGLDIHHSIPISKGGDKSSMKNMTLTHRACHIEHHSLHDKT